jgi:hypothetical protein
MKSHFVEVFCLHDAQISKYLCNHKTKIKGVRVMVFNATFNNISVISWQSVLLVEETGAPGEKPRLLN